MDVPLVLAVVFAVVVVFFVVFAVVTAVVVVTKGTFVVVTFVVVLAVEVVVSFCKSVASEDMTVVVFFVVVEYVMEDEADVSGVSDIPDNSDVFVVNSETGNVVAVVSISSIPPAPEVSSMLSVVVRSKNEGVVVSITVSLSKSRS